jgi:hypothetical protein
MLIPFWPEKQGESDISTYIGGRFCGDRSSNALQIADFGAVQKILTIVYITLQLRAETSIESLTLQ